MKKETLNNVELALNNILKYKVKVGANCVGYNMQLDLLKLSITDEVELQKAKELLVEKLIINKMWKISRVSFDNKEIYKARLIKFHDSLVAEGVLVKDKLATNRFLLEHSLTETTKDYYTVGANITKCSIPKEITRHEMVKNRKVSKKEVKDSLSK